MVKKTDTEQKKYTEKPKEEITITQAIQQDWTLWQKSIHDLLVLNLEELRKINTKLEQDEESNTDIE